MVKMEKMHRKLTKLYFFLTFSWDIPYFSLALSVRGSITPAAAGGQGGCDMTPQYETLMAVVQQRMSVRRLKPDPLPEGAIEKILEAGRWAMSGANAQPWEYIVVTDPAVKKALYGVYMDEVDSDFIFWMEQMRVPELRHPSFHLAGTPEQQIHELTSRPGWSEAPALIVVIGDGRRQWATVMGGHTFGRHASHLTDGLANTCTLDPSGSRLPGVGHPVGYGPRRGRFQTGLERSGPDDRLLYYPCGLSRCSAEKRHSPSAGRPDPPQSIRPRQVPLQSADNGRPRQAAAGDKTEVLRKPWRGREGPSLKPGSHLMERRNAS